MPYFPPKFMHASPKIVVRKRIKNTDHNTITPSQNKLFMINRIYYLVKPEM